MAAFGGKADIENPAEMAGQADTESAEDEAAGLAAASGRVMNCQCERKYSIHLVVGRLGRSRYRCRWRSTASVADNAIPVGRRFRIRPILRAAE